MSKATSRAEAEGIHIPTVNEPSETQALMEMMRSMADELKTLRAPPPAPALVPAPIPEPAPPVLEKAKAKPKPKPKPKPKAPEPEPEPVISPYQEKMVRLDALRRALGRK
jgi:protein TonB